jgi:hypothetical protein
MQLHLLLVAEAQVAPHRKPYIDIGYTLLFSNVVNLISISFLAFPLFDIFRWGILTGNGRPRASLIRLKWFTATPEDFSDAAITFYTIISFSLILLCLVAQLYITALPFFDSKIVCLIVLSPYGGTWFYLVVHFYTKFATLVDDS